MFGEMWDKLDMLLSSTLSSKKVTVKTVPTSSGAMWGRALVCPRFLFLFFFHLSHRATVDFLHSCNAVNRVDVTPLKHAGLIDIYIQRAGTYMFCVNMYSDGCTVPSPPYNFKNELM